MAKLPPRPVGIDLGTTFSAVSCLTEAGAPRTLCNAEGEGVTASAVLINPDRSIIVGHEALAARRTRPDHVAVNFKRDMGEKFFHQSVGGRQFAPEALAALVLKKLAQDAREAIEDITGVVITVPAYFGDHRRRATQDAGRIASLNVIDIINEPTAAALANAFRAFLAGGGQQQDLDVARIAARAPTTTLVYDLGGGTFDVTVIRIDSNNFEVIATGGEVRLGGIDFDDRLVQYVADEFLRRFGVDPRDVPEAQEALRARCEQAKIELSQHDHLLFRYAHLGRQLDLPIPRQHFEQLTADLVSRTQISTEMLIEDALLNWEKIDNILLVGGASRMPAVARMLERVSGKMPDMAIAPDQIVAHGAAIHAAIISLRERASTPAPGGARRFDSNPPDDESAGSDAANPEAEYRRLQAIFEPAVVEAAQQVDMTDVNAHALGVIVRSSQEQRTVNSVIIPRNTPLPTSRVKVFGTEAPDQRRVRLRITEGDTRDPRGCVQIGECVIKQLPKGLPRGAPVEVSFRYDASGCIHVRAVELTSRISADVELRRDSGFEPTDLELLTDALRELDVQ